MSLQDAYDTFDLGKEEALEWFQGEIVGLRSGRVKPDAVTKVQVEHYGTRSPLQTLAGVSNIDARTLLITPYDPSSVKAIEKAITEANLGVNPSVDGNVVRLAFPSLTAEIREQTVRQLHKKAEEARIRLRQTRDEALKMIKDEKENDSLPEDDFYNGKEKLDEMIGKANDDIEGVMKKKEAEITTI